MQAGRQAVKLVGRQAGSCVRQAGRRGRQAGGQAGRQRAGRRQAGSEANSMQRSRQAASQPSRRASKQGGRPAAGRHWTAAPAAEPRTWARYPRCRTTRRSKRSTRQPGLRWLCPRSSRARRRGLAELTGFAAGVLGLRQGSALGESAMSRECRAGVREYVGSDSGVFCMCPSVVRMERPGVAATAPSPGDLRGGCRRGWPGAECG